MNYNKNKTNDERGIILYYNIVSEYLKKIDTIVKSKGNNENLKKLKKILAEESGIVITKNNSNNIISQPSNMHVFNELYKDLRREISVYAKINNISEDFKELFQDLGGKLDAEFENIGSSGGGSNNKLSSLIEKSKEYYASENYDDFLKVSSKILNIVAKEYSNVKNSNVKFNLLKVFKKY